MSLEANFSLPVTFILTAFRHDDISDPQIIQSSKVKFKLGFLKNNILNLLVFLKYSINNKKTNCNILEPKHILLCKWE